MEKQLEKKDEDGNTNIIELEIGSKSGGERESTILEDEDGNTNIIQSEIINIRNRSGGGLEEEESVESEEEPDAESDEDSYDEDGNLISSFNGGSSREIKEKRNVRGKADPEKEKKEEKTPPPDAIRSASDPIIPSDYNHIRPTSIEPLEKKLTLFALYLAIIVKVASGLGKLAFVWATVVLLGGLASDLEPKDFWFITAILVVEGARLFTNSRELEWLHQSTRIIPTNTSSRSIQSTQPLPTQIRNPSDGSLLQAGWIFITKSTSYLLYWLQILTAVACIALSLMRLRQQNYGDDAKINKKSALNVFYSLALIEALMLLFEKCFWRIKCKKLIEQVSKDFDLDPNSIDSLHCFFYNAYSRCIDGNILDGLKMDLVSFAEKLLDSDSPDEYIIGARILEVLVKKEQFAANTLHKIRNSQVIERLIEMLNWENAAEENTRRSASKIVLKLASSQHAIRVTLIPRAMESISSLLRTRLERRWSMYVGVLYEISMARCDFRHFNQIGLLILKSLARDQDNCWKIVNTQGLLERIIDLTNLDSEQAANNFDPNFSSLSRVVRHALEVVNILACAKGQIGNVVRRDISDNLYLVGNIRKLLEYNDSIAELQKLGLQILANLGLNEEAREKIGATGCMLTLIIKKLFRTKVRMDACEALVMLIFESKRNCERILREGDAVNKLLYALEDQIFMREAMTILRDLCAYSAPEQSDRLQIVARAMPKVLKAIMECKLLLMASIGLAIQMLKYINAGDLENIIKRAGIEDENFVEKLVMTLQEHENPEWVPRMRRDVIELAIALMKYEGKYIKLFRNLGMEQVLIRTAETTSELECFNIISGSVGLSRREEMISSLVDTALKLLNEG